MEGSLELMGFSSGCTHKEGPKPAVDASESSLRRISWAAGLLWSRTLMYNQLLWSI